MSQAKNPYGMGDAASKIVNIIADNFYQKSLAVTKNDLNIANVRRLEISC
jgi:UDP-N-acetylglucosamine 2-epimerase